MRAERPVSMLFSLRWRRLGFNTTLLLFEAKFFVLSALKTNVYLSGTPAALAKSRSI